MPFQLEAITKEMIDNYEMPILKVDTRVLIKPTYDFPSEDLVLRRLFAGRRFLIYLRGHKFYLKEDV